MRIGLIRITMFAAYPQPPHTPCPHCGASVELSRFDNHVCDPDKKLDYHLYLVRDEVAAFDEELATWLASARGRFAAWLAERERPAFG
jgi:hypothetical protein